MSYKHAPIPGKCKEAIYTGGFSSPYRQCKVTCWLDGFCKQHHPDTVKQRKAAQHARWDERQKARQAMYDAPRKRIAELEAALLRVQHGLEGADWEQTRHEMIDFIINAVRVSRSAT